MAKPGVMIYWDMFDTMDRMKPEKVKILLTAIRNLAQRGESPDFGDDEALNLVWPMIQQRIKADAERYEAIREARAEAGRKSGNSRAENAKQTQANQTNAAFAKQTQANQTNAAFAKQTQANQTNAAFAKQTQANQANNSYSNSYSYNNSNNYNYNDNNNESENKMPPAPANYSHFGEYGNVLLTEEELQKLKATVPDWEALVNKLSGYMASTGKTYANHFATLKRWAEQDKQKEAEQQKKTERVYEDKDDNITGRVGIWL